MVTATRSIGADTLRRWLQQGKAVSIVDVRPAAERAEWYIPGSIHLDAYDKLKADDSGALAGLNLDKAIPVTMVCAAGRTAQKAADLLSQQGYEAYSLDGGMKGWTLAWNMASLHFTGYEVIQIRRTGKGCLSYVIASEGEAVVIDASLPAEVYETILKEKGWKLKAVAETHIHADHLSRSKQLADERAVSLLLPIPNKVSFPYKNLEPGQDIQLESVVIQVIPTPGHTLESVCFLINSEVLLSGDTLFTNAVGRPDLKAGNEEAKHRAGLLYDSLQKLMELNGTVKVLPAHTNRPVDFDGKPIQATLAEIRSKVPVLQLSRTDFVTTILDKLPPAPPNYLTIVTTNLSGTITGVNPVELEAGANRCAVS